MPPTTYAQLATITAGVAEDNLALEEAAEFIVHNSISNGNRVSADEWLVLRRAGIVDADGYEGKRQLQSAQQRALTIQKHQARAGTAASRKAARDALDKARETLSEQGPELKQKIAALQAELEGLENNVTSAERAVHDIEQARAALRQRSMLPDRVLREHGDAQSAVLGPLTAEESRLKTQRSRCLKAMSYTPGAMDFSQQAEMKNHRHFRTDDRPWLREKTSAENPREIKTVIDAGSWDAYVAECKAAIPEIEARLAELDIEIAEQRDELGRMLDFHLQD